MSDVTVLSQGGIQQAADIVSIAAASRLELAAAATLLIKESGGGRNVWGHDDVIVAPDTYVKGASVTEVDLGFSRSKHLILPSRWDRMHRAQDVDVDRSRGDLPRLGRVPGIQGDRSPAGA